MTSTRAEEHAPLQAPPPAVNMNMAYSYMATYQETGPSGRGVPFVASLSPDCMMSMRPGSKLLDRAADVLMFNAAAILRARTGADVRVVPSGTYREWEDWQKRRYGQAVQRRQPTKQLVSAEPPTSMSLYDLSGAEYVLVARHGADHYSTMFFSNFGADPSLMSGARSKTRDHRSGTNASFDYLEHRCAGALLQSSPMPPQQASLLVVCSTGSHTVDEVAKPLPQLLGRLLKVDPNVIASRLGCHKVCPCRSRCILIRL